MPNQDDQLSVVVVANCQSQPLARLLGSTPRVSTAVGVPIHLYGGAEFEKFAESADQVLSDERAVVLTFDISDAAGRAFSTSSLRKRKRRLLTMTNVYFDGLHPDVTYLGSMGKRLASPIGDYHSRLILHSYLTGRTVGECSKRFCANEFERLGFMGQFEISARELINRDRDLDIKFAENLIGLLKEIPCLFTVNHPTNAAFLEYYKLICDRLGLQAISVPAELVENELAVGAMWPVYPEITESLGLKYRMPMVFRQSRALGGRFMPLDDFIVSSYKIYEQDRDWISSNPQARDILAKWGHC